MSLSISSNPVKPNRARVSDKDNNPKYHLDYAKWAVGQSQTSEYNKWLAKVKINKDFYKGNQWTMEEDVEAFLKDESGGVKNRIKMVHNLIRPMVEQFRGNASILKINATANSISKMAVNRRDLALSERLFRTKLANEFPGLGEIMRKNDDSIGENEQETIQIFENLYVDMYVSQLNSLLKYSSNLNEFQRKQIRIAQNLALSGISIVEGFQHGGHLRFRVIESEDFFWDTDARELDLSDASFMGYMNPMDATMIAERWQITPDQLKRLEDYSSNNGSSPVSVFSSSNRKHTSSRIPVYKVFWKDSERYEYAYVNDEFGYPLLDRVNYIHPGETEPRYTDKDIIDPPFSPLNKNLFKKGKKRMMYVDVIRSCTFIPGEIIASATEKQNKSDMDNNLFDIVLEYGMEDYQETDMLDLSNVKYPLKVQTWGYVDGEVFSPVDDAINPQRFINRVLSVTEQLINSSGGSSVIIDEDAIDPNSKGQIYSDISEGKPITVRTKGKGVPNTVGYYDATPKTGVYNMFNIIPTIKSMIQDTTGVNEALKGESTGSDQLVGVTELLIQRGSLMQEPFYNAISDLYVQMYQYVATVGKRIYLDNERELAVITGDEGVRLLEMSKDMKNEDFRVFVNRENDDSILKSQANQMLNIFMQSGLIDDKVFANLYNRSTPDDVTMALRSQAGLRAEASRRAAKEQQAMQQQAEQQAMALQERDRQDKINTEDKHLDAEYSRQQTDMDKTLAKQIFTGDKKGI